MVRVGKGPSSALSGTFSHLRRRKREKAIIAKRGVLFVAFSRASSPNGEEGG
jgi:hypothetical protein